MNQSTTSVDRLHQLIGDVFGVDPHLVTDDSSPETIPAWDSLNHLNLVMALESEFGLSLTPDEALTLHNVAAVRMLLQHTAAPAQASSVILRDCRREDIAAFKAFIARSYGPNYVLGVNDEYFEWQYRRTAVSEGRDYHLRLAWVDGQIAGCLGYIPAEVSLAGQIWDACWLANWMVDPDQRHLGLGPVLARDVSKDFQITLALGANAEARDILSRMGWTDFGMLHRYVAVLNRTEAASLTASGTLDWPLPESPALKPCPTVERVSRFSDEVVRLWDRAYGNQVTVAGTRRTAGFLNWRYADHRQFEYRLFENRRAGELVGLGVYRVEQARDMPIRVGRILELVGHPDSDRDLLATMLADAQAEKAVAIDYFCGSTARRTELAQYGFLHGEDAAASQIPVLYQPIDRRRAGIRFLADLRQVPDAVAVTDWYVSKADGDQDRPN